MKNLTIITLVYIILPTYFFLFFWVNVNYSVLSMIALTVALFLAIYKLGNYNPDTANPEFSLSLSILSSGLIALVLCYFSEFGSFDYQSYDYQAHNFKFNLLATQPLPLYDQERDIYMCYYLGYYIVPSLLGKITSVSLIKYFAFFWTWLGLTLSFSWIQVRLRKLKTRQRLLICLLLILGSYVSIILPLLNHLFSGLAVFDNNSVLINGKFVLNQLPILSKSISEATQHTLPAFLAICFFITAITDLRYFYAFSVFILSTLFWTPFTAVGLSFFCIYFVIKGFQKNQFRFIGRAALFGILLLVAYYPVIIFLLSSAATSMESNLFIWQSGSSYWPFYYLLYLFVFFGIWFIFFRKELLEFDRELLLVSFISFAAIGLAQLGYFNDLNTRASIASQVVLGLSIAYALVTHAKNIIKNKFLLLGGVFLVLNSLSFIKFYYERLFILNVGTSNTIENPHLDLFGDNYYTFLEKGYQNGQEVVKQYSLKKDSLFEKYLLKRN
jgi:hypothetical protein